MSTTIVPLAKQIADAQQQQKNIAALGPEPAPIPYAMMEDASQSAVPALAPAFAKQPTVIGPSDEQKQIAYTQGQLEKVREAKARPYGFAGAAPSSDFPNGLAPNHPGKMGHVLHALAVAGNIAGNIVAPGTMSMIPGTQLNLQGREQDLTNRENTEIGQEAKNASENAQTNEANIRAKTLPLQIAESAGEQGLEVGPNGTLVPQAPENQSPGFKTKQELEQAQIYGLKNPWAKLPDKEPLTNVDAINSGMADRYQVLHPGEPLPAHFQLPANATKGDFDRVDKLLSSEETALGTKQQRDFANQMREQMMSLAHQRINISIANQGEKGAQSVMVPNGQGGYTLQRVLPGQTVGPGAITTSGMSGLNAPKPTADEQRRADLAENLNENLSTIEAIARKRPELFGPLAGRWTELKQKFGSKDPDISALQTSEHQLGMAQISAHGMRSAQGIQAAADSIMNNLHNPAPALISSINTARNSIKTFTADVNRGKQGGGGQQGGTPQRPTGVPQDFIFNANGAKGAGWYRPKGK